MFVSQRRVSESPRKGWAYLRAGCVSEPLLPLLERGVRKGTAKFVRKTGPGQKAEIMRWVVKDGAKTMTIDLLVKC